MKIEIDLRPSQPNRTVSVALAPSEIESVHLHLASPAARNRSGLYMRRHPKTGVNSSTVGPNSPLREPAEPRKLTIGEHLEEMRRSAVLPTVPKLTTNEIGESFGVVPAILAVPVSDLVANLLRPCFSRDGFGDWRTFFFEDEPIDRRTYWALCCFEERSNCPTLRFIEIRFDPAVDSVFSLEGEDLAAQGLRWAASLVPLVKQAQPQSPIEIAENDYDLRQIFGRAAETEINHAYAGWYDGWNSRVAALTRAQMQHRRPFELFYHSVLALDGNGDIHIFQLDGRLPELAERLAADGIVAAGLLDSGGSCALYDGWLGGYLNHGWYYREPRGAILVFELKTKQRIPRPRPGQWRYLLGTVESDAG